MSYLPYFTPREVAIHNNADDIWVSFLGKVHNLTQLLKDNSGDILLKPILLAAGTDISHWFDKKTGNVRTHIDPRTNCTIPFCPNGRYLHIPPPYPDSTWANDFGRPWWFNELDIVGNLSQKTRFIKLVNTLTSQSHVIEVCAEETMNEILLRYLKYNAHARSYTWKYNCENLDMAKNLEENGIEDEDEEFYKLSMNDDTFLQCVHLYYNDDLTEDDLEKAVSLVPSDFILPTAHSAEEVTVN